MRWQSTDIDILDFEEFRYRGGYNSYPREVVLQIYRDYLYQSGYGYSLDSLTGQVNVHKIMNRPMTPSEAFPVQEKVPEVDKRLLLLL